MNILQQAKELYDKCNIDMFTDITRYMAYGHVFISPNQFFLLKPVDKNLKTNPINQWHVESPNAWYIHMAIGKVKDFIGQAPYSLPMLDGCVPQKINQLDGTILIKFKGENNMSSVVDQVVDPG